MAYNTKKGSQHSGDIQYEGDPNDTQIDFENDSIGLKTGGATRVLVTDTGLSGSAGLQTVGATTLGNTLSVSGTVSVAQRIDHAGDANTYVDFTDDDIQFYAGNKKLLQLNESTNSKVVVGNSNEDIDFLVTTISDDYAIFAEGSTNKVGIGTSTPSEKFTVDGNISGSSTLQAVGATTLGNTLNVSGATTLAGNLTLPEDGDISGSGGLYIQDLSVLGGHLRVSGSISSSYAGYAIQAFQMLTANNQIALGASTTTLYPAGDAWIANAGHYSGSKSLVVGGPISGSGTLFMSGTISGAADISGSALYVGGDMIGGGTHTVLDTVHISSSLPISGAGMFLSGNQPTIGLFSNHDGNAGVIKFGRYGGVKTAEHGALIQYNTVNDIEFTNHTPGSAIRFYICDLSDADTFEAIRISGSGGNNDGFGIKTTSFYDFDFKRKVSGSNTLEIVGATTLGSTLNVSGAATLGNYLRATGYISSSTNGLYGSRLVTANNKIEIGEQPVATPLTYPLGDARILNQGHYSGSMSLYAAGPISGSSTLAMSGAISGAAELQAVGAATLESTLSVSGNATIGGPNQANSRLYVKGQDDSVVTIFKSDSHDNIMAITGSGEVTIGGIYLDAYFNVSGADNRKLIAATGTSRGKVFSVSSSGETFISGNIQLQSVEPTIHFSGSTGTHLAQIGTNDSDNLVIQNNTQNRHIVFKVNDGGVVREGLRLDGAVPEVVVNQTPHSMINFRVESATNDHMLFVSGATNQVGIGVSDPAPEVSLDISGSAIRLRNSSTPASAGAPGLAGEIRWDADYIYICIANDTWKRVAISTW